MQNSSIFTDCPLTFNLPVSFDHYRLQCSHFISCIFLETNTSSCYWWLSFDLDPMIQLIHFNVKKLYPVLYKFQVCMSLGLSTNIVIASKLWSIQDAVFLLSISILWSSTFRCHPCWPLCDLGHVTQMTVNGMVCHRNIQFREKKWEVVFFS